VLDAKGKIVSDMVMVKGREEHHAEGNYVISFYNLGKLIGRRWTFGWRTC
jgi:hypothetical protein